MTDNIIITTAVLENMPNEDMFSPDNEIYFDNLYSEFIVNASKWFEEDERA